LKAHDQKLKNELTGKGLLSEEQCRLIESGMLKNRTSFKAEVLRQSLVSEENLLSAEADVMGLGYIDLSQVTIDDKILKTIPESIARSHAVIPVFKLGKLTVATSEPSDLLALDEVRAAAGGDIDLALAPKGMILKAIDLYYSGAGSLAEATKPRDYFKVSAGDKAAVLGGAAPGKGAGEGDDVSAIHLVNQMILTAIKEKASDIHIEPEENFLRVRNRVDGLLHEAGTFDKKSQAAIASRIKIMAKMDISENRKPQDGKIRMKIENQDLDIRVSTFPTTHGENVVLRLLEQSKVILGLNELGMDADGIKKFDTLIHKPYGMILVTGPTGAGKTTTLYAALNTINTVDKNIITIEDPVEYQLELVRQTQVNPKAGLTFATGLRSILRQDPDVVLVGEIRDGETVAIAIESALTGYLVFSTIHTNDAAGAVARMLDMGAEPFLVSSALAGVIAQRLVRAICEKCREKITIDEATWKQLGDPSIGHTFYVGKGCVECKMTGYSRRLAIFEILMIDEPVRNLILRKASSKEIKAEAMRRGMATMRQDGLLKAQKGMTTLAEVLKATQEDE
jgi:type II secretory ATPase GspE/PulE/Tfp pilus assembly ATPase PilB-like protein